MDAIFFDPLKFLDELKAADVPEKQARAQAEAMRNAFASYDASRMKELATKEDMHVFGKEIYALRDDISSMRSEMREMEVRIIKWGVGAIIAQTALLATFVIITIINNIA